MDISKSFVSEEEKYVLLRLSGLSEKKDELTTGFFMSPREIALAKQYSAAEGFSERICFYGGFIGAQRRAAIFLAEWMSAYCGNIKIRKNGESYDCTEDDETITELISDGIISEDDIMISYLSLEGSGYVNLSHSDWLGALMSLGIKRECVGDISLLSDCTAVCAVLSKNADYISSELKKAARDHVSAKPCTKPDNIKAPETEILSGSVKSPRADGIVRELCHVSRDKAVSLINTGEVSINYMPLSETDEKINEGDTVSVRGYGKFKISEYAGNTKSGRLRIVYEKYK